MPNPPERTPLHGLSLPRYEFAADKIRREWLVVDAACGTGDGVRILRESTGAVVIGVDAAAPTADVPSIIANVEAQDFAGFDACVCIEALSHFIDPMSWLKGLATPHLIISMPTIPSMALYPWRKHEFTEKQFRDMIEPKWKIRDEFRQDDYITVHAAW